ncbi:MAG: hypothetical protein R3B07_32110 [Polyangiaceae bacterium]
MNAHEVRREIERTLREPSPDVELAAWLLDLAPPDSLEAIELRRALADELRRRAA